MERDMNVPMTLSRQKNRSEIICFDIYLHQHHIGAAGPALLRGTEKVAGTEPKTPIIEMAYDNVDRRVNSRLNSAHEVNGVILILSLISTNLACSQSPRGDGCRARQHFQPHPSPMTRLVQPACSPRVLVEYDPSSKRCWSRC